jgi:hypothetical protein
MSDTLVTVRLVRLGESRRPVMKPRTQAVMWAPATSVLPAVSQGYRIQKLSPGVWHAPHQYEPARDCLITACGQRIPGQRLEQMEAEVHPTWLHVYRQAQTGKPQGTPRLCRRCFP